MSIPTQSIPTQPINLPIYINAETTAGRTYIVTGANVGLGRETSRHLVALGAAKVIMAVRNMESGKAALADIEASTGKSGTAELWQLDLGSYDSVKAFAAKATQLERIDALIENAGLSMPIHVLAEGHPMALTVNVYSTFLLAFLLFPKLREDAKRLGTNPYITIVTSTFAFAAQGHWDLIKGSPKPFVKMAELEQQGTTEDINTYALTKLFEMQAVRHIAPLIPVSETGVVINLVCPGVCQTELTRNTSEKNKAQVQQLRDVMGRTAEDGSRTFLFAATAGPDSHGRMSADCEIKAEEFTPEWIRGEEAKGERQHVWELIAEQLNAVAPGCVDKVLKA